MAGDSKFNLVKPGSVAIAWADVCGWTCVCVCVRARVRVRACSCLRAHRLSLVCARAGVCVCVCVSVHVGVDMLLRGCRAQSHVVLFSLLSNSPLGISMLLLTVAFMFQDLKPALLEANNKTCS